MAQTVPSPAPEGIPRPLPRGGRLASARSTRPRFQAADAVWMVLLAAVSAAVSAERWGVRPMALYNLTAGAGVVALTYLLGWRASGRAAGVIGGLLLATGPAVMPPSLAALSAEAFALLAVASLFALVAGSSLAALALAAIATALRPEGLLLGLLLLTLSLIQHRKRAAWGAAVFLLSVVLAAYVLLHDGYGSLFARPWGFHPDLLRWVVGPSTAFLTWFLLPFCGELGDAARRARWLPVVLWAALLLVWQTVAGSPFLGGTDLALTLFLPLWSVLVGAGLARLLPALTGDIPAPAARYVIATVAVLSLVALRACSDLWIITGGTPEVNFAAMRPPIVPAPVVLPATPRPFTASTPPRRRPVAVRKRAIKPPKSSTVTPQYAPLPAKPAVRQYIVQNGRLVRRSKWAIQWDLTHPHH